MTRAGGRLRPLIRAFTLAAACLMPGVAHGDGREVTLSSADGIQLAGTLFDARLRPAPGVVLVHMLGRSKDDWSDMGRRFQEAGLTALAIDLRGHGRSGGSATISPAMAEDVRAAIAWLRSRPGVRPDAIGLAGASLGANLALTAAAAVPSLRALALLSPALDYRGVRIDTGMLKRYGGRPAWLAASTGDPYALRTLRELAADASGPREQRLTAVTAHGTGMLAADPALAGELVDWFRRTLMF
jgi:dienelactone hydrolase